ncbi:hypothetical protein [Alkalicoccus luteus]|uniref:hypothetical protein n=1 Tax=Alkalicoccus luteus TaxID=1237094 RepID=UPI00197C6E14|nr:hypothetical protein [Alkalicoccus luteus]
MLREVEKLFKSEISSYRMAKESGVPENTVRRLRTGEAKLENATYKNIESLYNYYQKEMGNMAKIYYDDILIGEIVTNRSMTVEEALNLIDFDEEEFIREQGFDDVDPNDYRLEY